MGKWNGGPDRNAGRQSIATQPEGLAQLAGDGRHHRVEAQSLATHSTQVWQMGEIVGMGWSVQRA